MRLSVKQIILIIIFPFFQSNSQILSIEIGAGAGNIVGGKHGFGKGELIKVGL